MSYETTLLNPYSRCWECLTSHFCVIYAVLLFKNELFTHLSICRVILITQILQSGRMQNLEFHLIRTSETSGNCTVDGC